MGFIFFPVLNFYLGELENIIQKGKKNYYFH